MNRAETRRNCIARHTPLDVRRCGTQRDQQALAETLRSGFEFPWGHHEFSEPPCANRGAHLRECIWRRTVRSTSDGTHVPFACLAEQKRPDDERFRLALSGIG